MSAHHHMASTNDSSLTGVSVSRSVRPVAERLAQHGYLVQNVLGVGSYSQVRKAWSAMHECPVAVKIIDKTKAKPRLLNHFLPRELDIIVQLHHPNIISVLQVLKVDPAICIVEELAEGGNLLTKVKSVRNLSESEARPMVRQLLEALRYLHGMSIVHRDLKCENVLLDKYHNVKLGDFTFSRRMAREDLSHTFCGSLGYVAPEIIRRQPYKGYAVDYWSLGVIVYILVTGIFPFSYKNVQRMLDRQMSGTIVYPPHVSPEARQLITILLEPEPSSRAKYQQAKQSAWLMDTPWIIRLPKTQVARIQDHSTSPIWHDQFTIQPVTSTAQH